MDIFDVLTLIGGLCLFLFGMDLMGQALERSAGSKLTTLLGRLTTNKVAGLLTGLGVTAIIQSSSATTVMVVGFVNSSIMTLKQAIHVIMGANIGTTVTAWLLSLSGIDSGNLFVQLLKPTSFTPILALIGIILHMFGKTERRKDIGTILLGFATLMFGMDIMSGAVSGLKDVPAFQQLFIMFQNPILGVLAGAILTAIIQSSSASVGILQALTVTGQISYSAAIPIIMGQNIGTCITAILSCIGTNKNARRAALVHLSFNVLGTIIWLSVFSIVQALVKPALFTMAADAFGIAICHSIFNILCTILMLPLSSLLEKLAYILVPEGKSVDKVVELDERLLATPPFALESSRVLTVEMANNSVLALKKSLEALSAYTPDLAAEVRDLEEKSDHYEDILGTYLVKLSTAQLNESESAQVAKLLKVIADFERISDYSVNILESVEEMREKDIVFTPKAQDELNTILFAVDEILDLTLRSFTDSDLHAAVEVEPLEQVIDDLKETLRTRHIRRLQAGECSIIAGFVWSDLLTALSRTSDHCSNIAGSVIDEAQLNMNIHESLRAMRAGDPAFAREYRNFTRKYQLN